MKKIDRKTIEELIVENYNEDNIDGILLLPLRGADALRVISLVPIYISNDRDWDEDDYNWTRGRPSVAEERDTYRAWTLLGSSLERWDSEED